MSRTDPAKAVAAVIAAYAEGTRSRDTAALAALFHPCAVMVGHVGPDLLTGGPQPFFDSLAANNPGPAYAWAITEVSVIGATATATLVEDGLFGRSFVNRFHLIREGESHWRITAKLFHHD